MIAAQGVFCGAKQTCLRIAINQEKYAAGLDLRENAGIIKPV